MLVKYKDTLIVIEVKAGSFTYTPAITDFVSHKKSLETLVEKAEAQCLRVKSYIENNEVICVKQENGKLDEMNFAHVEVEKSIKDVVEDST